MDKIEYLVDQHVREFDLKMRHIDQLLADVRKASTAPRAPAAAVELLHQAEAKRNALAQEFGRFRRIPPGDPEQARNLGQRLKTTIDSVGAELEKTLAAVLDKRGL